MKSAWGIAALAAAAIVFLHDNAAAQCRRGGGGGQSAAASAGGTSVDTGARLLQGPGSWAYDVMLAQRAQQAYLQRQYAFAAQKAAHDAERKSKQLATARERRAKELARRQQRRQTLAQIAAVQ